MKVNSNDVTETSLSTLSSAADAFQHKMNALKSFAVCCNIIDSLFIQFHSGCGCKGGQLSVLLIMLIIIMIA